MSSDHEALLDIGYLFRGWLSFYGQALLGINGILLDTAR